MLIPLAIGGTGLITKCGVNRLCIFINFFITLTLILKTKHQFNTSVV